MLKMLEKLKTSIFPKKFKILFIPTQNSGVVYWRIYNFVREMRENPNLEVAMLEWDPANPYAHVWQANILNEDTKMKQLDVINNLCFMADIIVFQYVANAMALGVMRCIQNNYKSKLYLMETDDFVLSTPEYHSAIRDFRPGSEFESIFIEQMRFSDSMIVTTPGLKERCLPFNKNIDIVPNSIDFKDWENLEIPKHDDIRIGWVGGASHNGNLELIKNVIFRILEEEKNVHFHCIHGIPQFFRDVKGIVLDEHYAAINNYPQFVASHGFDIGVAPLVDNAFNRSKSNLKWLEYSAMKIPTIASNVGNYKETLEHGKTGFLAETEEDWYKYLKLLIKDERMRKQIGFNAYMAVKSRFNIKKTAKEYVKLLRRLYDKRRY